MINGKKIIVTGGAGFLGINLVRILEEHGIPKKDIFVPREKEYDLRKKEDIERMFNKFPADIVIHLAAHSGGIEYYKKHPGSLFYDNLFMGIQLIEVSRIKKIDKFVIIGTGLVYPKDAPIPLREDSIWQGYPEESAAPYGLASRALLAQSQAYRKEYGFNSIYLILPNLYGPEDHFELEIAHVIPSLIVKINKAKIEKMESIGMFGTGNASREFMYVRDAARAIILAIERYDKPEPLNIGTGKDIPLREVVEKVAKIMNYKGKIIWDSSKSEGQLRRCFDSSRTEKEIGFKPETSMDEGLRETIDWFKENQKGE